MSKKPTNDRSIDLHDTCLLKDEHIMDLFGISKSCLYQWRKKKKIPFIKIGGLNFYIKEVILKMIYMRGGKLPKGYDEDDENDDEEQEQKNQP